MVKWHGKFSSVKPLNGSGPQGSTIGLLEYLAQSNKSADCVDQENRFKFLDDLTILEVINILAVGISSFNIENQVPNEKQFLHTSRKPENPTQHNDL